MSLLVLRVRFETSKNIYHQSATKEGVHVEKHYQKQLFMGKFLTWNVWGVDCAVPNAKVPNYLLWASWFL